MRKVILSNVLVEGWITYPNKYRLLDMLWQRAYRKPILPHRPVPAPGQPHHISAKYSVIKIFQHRAKAVSSMQELLKNRKRKYK